MPKITIHTATYNRAYILPKAYESLKAQTCKNFEWIITDDGSTDDTEKLVQDWIQKRNDFEIRYYKLKHVGLPIAQNTGVESASTDWFMRLDSDDSLRSNAIELIQPWIREIELDNHFCGIGFGKCYPDGRYMKDQKPIIDPEIGYVDATHLERVKYNLDMDMCEVHRVSVLKQFPLQCWPGEYFAPEQLQLYATALAGYYIRWHSEKLNICDYQEDGLTKDDSIVKNNPMGFAMMHNQNMLIRESFPEKCKCAMQMTALSLYASHPEYLRKTNCLPATLLTLPLGVALSFRRKRQFSKML